jgi:transcriptional regulator
MYLPAHFAITDTAPLYDLIQTDSLGLLTTQENGQVFADPIPFFLTQLNDKAVLHCHVARANPVWQRLEKNAHAMVVFQGPTSYVSPSYYPSKKEHGKVVPTWNYAVVQARGQAKVMHDPAWLHAHVSANTNRHESRVGSDWKVTDAPTEYIDTMLKAIVGLVIPVEQLIGKFKVSQNQPRANRLGAAEALRKHTDEHSQLMAQLIEQAIKP